MLSGAIAYSFGLSFVGLALGLFAGGSATPVVATILPLIFGVIGGAGGLYIGVAKLDTPIEAFKLRFIGIAFAAFSISIIIGSLWGTSLRTGKPISSYLPTVVQTAKDSPISTAKNPNEAMALSVLRARLILLDVDEATVRSILKIASKQIAEKRNGLDGNRIKRVVDTAEHVGELVRQEIETAKDKVELIALRKLILWRANLLGGLAKTKGGSYRQSQVLFVGEIVKDSYSALNNPDFSNYSDNLRRGLITLYGEALEANNWLRNIEWTGKTRFTQSVDDFLLLTKGRSLAKKDIPVFVKDNIDQGTGHLF